MGAEEKQEGGYSYMDSKKEAASLRKFQLFPALPKILPPAGAAAGYSYSYGLIKWDSRRVSPGSASYDRTAVPLLVLPHLRPLGTSVGGKLLGTEGQVQQCIPSWTK